MRISDLDGVYRIWGGAVAIEDIATMMDDVRRMK